MILTAVFQMMTTVEVWNPTYLFKVDIPYSLKENQLPKLLNELPNPLKSKEQPFLRLFFLFLALQKICFIAGLLGVCSFSNGTILFYYIILDYYCNISKSDLTKNAIY